MFSEGIQTDHEQLRQLERLVRLGESEHLEFKRRASSPDQIVREMIAFANTSGGILLVGVNDDGQLSGVKYPDEESLVISKALKKFCKPLVHFQETLIPLSTTKFVIQYEVPLSRRRPHVFRVSQRQTATYIRIKDMTMKASREMAEVVRRGRSHKNVGFTYGDHEAALIRYLERKEKITLAEFQTLTGLTNAVAAEN